MIKLIRVKEVFILTGLLLVFLLFKCKSENRRSGSDNNVLTGYEENTYVSYRSFQNPDMTWGFTVFVNSVPYRHYDKVPYKSISRGFVSKKEADTVAALFVTLIKKGNASPHLNRRSIDTLNLTII